MISPPTQGDPFAYKSPIPGAPGFGAAFTAFGWLRTLFNNGIPSGWVDMQTIINTNP